MTRPDPSVEPAAKVPASSWGLLAALTLGYLLSLLDRLLLSLVVDPVRAQFGVSDSAIGLLQGPAFLLLYSVASIPLGRLIDRANRLRLVALGIFVWSLSTTAVAFCDAYWQIFVARIGVGLGEAILMPAAYSLMPDSFPRGRLGLAMGIFALGGALGIGASLSIGGAIYGYLTASGPLVLPGWGALLPWQQLFAVVGLPGLAMAALFLAMPEPRRREAAKSPARWSVIAAYARQEARWLIPFILAVGLSSSVLYSAATWIVVLLTRDHGLTIAGAATATGMVHMAASIVGTTAFGSLSDRMARRGAHRRLLLCVGALIVAAIAGVIYPLANGRDLCVALWGVVVLATSVPIATAASNFQENIAADYRGVMTGLLLLVVSTLSFLISTVVVAQISDHLFAGRIAFALAIVIPAAAAGSSLLFGWAAKAQRSAHA